MRELTVRYDAIVAVRDAALDLAPGSLLAIEGPNGAGKTSLLSAIAGTVPATGTIALDDERLERLGAERRARLGIALVPAGRRVFGRLTVEQNLLVGATALPRARVRAAVEAVFERFELLAERRAQRAGTLSGGEAQLVTIARALVAGPSVVLVDEPLHGLSAEAGELVLGVLRGIAGAGAAVLIASPDPVGELPAIVMEHGRLGVAV